MGGEVFFAVFLEEMACPFDFDLFARRVCAAEDPRITIGRKFAKATASFVARPLVRRPGEAMRFSRQCVLPTRRVATDRLARPASP